MRQEKLLRELLAKHQRLLDAIDTVSAAKPTKKTGKLLVMAARR